MNLGSRLDPLFFPVRGVPQAFTGFSSFEFPFGRDPGGIFSLIKENWEVGYWEVTLGNKCPVCGVDPIADARDRIKLNKTHAV